MKAQLFQDEAIFCYKLSGKRLVEQAVVWDP
jgi:hypothetical protein